MNEIVATDQASPPAVIPEGAGNLLSAIMVLARDPSVDVAKLSALLQMQERMEARQAERDFNEAFHRLEPELPRIRKNGDVEYKGQKAFRFAKWEDIDASIRPILRAHGFSLSFDTAPRQGDGGGLNVTGTLLHIGGHTRSASIPLPLDSSGGKNNLQGGGSTFSYGKRYTTTMLLNLIFESEDDDGARGGAVFMTDEHEAELRRLIKETNTDERRFLDAMCGGVNSLGEVEDKRFPTLVNALHMKMAKGQR